MKKRTKVKIKRAWRGFRCFTTFHHWQKIAPCSPIKKINGRLMGVFALNMCTWCGHTKFRKCMGTFQWYEGEEVTRGQYLEGCYTKLLKGVNEYETENKSDR